MYDEIRLDRQLTRADRLLHPFQLAHASKTLPFLIPKLENTENEPILSGGSTRKSESTQNEPISPPSVTPSAVEGLHRRFRTLSANAFVIPFTAVSSSIDAALMRLIEPKCLSNAVRLAGPMPGMASNADLIVRFVRTLRL